MSFGKRTATYAAAAAVIAVAIIGIAMLYPGTVAQSSTSSNTLSPSQNQGQTQTVHTISTSSAISSQQTSSPTQAGLQALLLVQLTDPPVVPTGTTSLNLTYSAIDLIVTEQGQNSQVTTNDVTVTPQGGSATVDLLQLQNVSQTIATASIPANSTIYSISFTVTGISIGVNGTSSTVALATGSNTFQVTLAKPALVSGTTAALLQLNPVIVDTPTGYQMIPSAVAIVKGGSQITHQDETVGSKQQLTGQENSDLNSAKGQVSARLVGLSSTGNTTTVTVQVNNTGSAPIQLVAIGLHGNFGVQSTVNCTSTSSTSATSSSSTSTSSTSTASSSNSTSSSHGEGSGAQQNGNGHGQNTSSTTSISTNSTDASHGEGSGGQQNGQQNAGDHQNGAGNCTGSDHGRENGPAGNELVFVPVTPGTMTTSSSSSSASSSTSSSPASSSSSSSSSSSTSTTSTSSASSSSTTTAAGTCTTVNMSLPSGDNYQEGHGGLTLTPGQCVTLTFTGVISFGHSQITVVANAAAGQTYTLHVIASDSAETMMNCVLPLTETSCTLTNAHND